MSTLNLSPDDEETSSVLWVCPECSSERTTLRYCDDCNYFGLRRSINAEVEMARRDTNKGWLVGLGILIAIGVSIWGFGYGGFSSLFGVSDGQANASSSPTPSPSPTPKPFTEEEIRALEAIKAFVATRYPEWIPVGNNFDPLDMVIYGRVGFDLHLSKGNESKVISVILGEFRKDDGSKYWMVYPAPPATPSRPQIDEEP